MEKSVKYTISASFIMCVVLELQNLSCTIESTLNHVVDQILAKNLTPQGFQLEFPKLIINLEAK